MDLEGAGRSGKRSWPIRRKGIVIKCPMFRPGGEEGGRSLQPNKRTRPSPAKATIGRTGKEIASWRCTYPLRVDMWFIDHQRLILASDDDRPGERTIPRDAKRDYGHK